MPMTDQLMTADEFAELMRSNKPHLIEIEERAAAIGYGSIDVRLEVRAGVVAKMSFIETRTWVREKNLDLSKNT